MCQGSDKNTLCLVFNSCSLPVNKTYLKLLPHTSFLENHQSAASRVLSHARPPMTAGVAVINDDLRIFQAGGPVVASFRHAALTVPPCVLIVPHLLFFSSSSSSTAAAGDPILPHLEWLPAVPALHVHSGAAQPQHLRAHLPAVRVAGGGGGAELQPGLQYCQGNAQQYC